MIIREILEAYALTIFGFWILVFFLLWFPDKLKQIGLITEEECKRLKGEIEK